MTPHNLSIVDKLRKHLSVCSAENVEIIPPLALSDINAAEGKLGFALPGLLRSIYTEIGCGCLGFQCSFLEPIRSQPAQGDPIDDFSMVELYQQSKSNKIIPTRSDPFGEWPDQLIPFCSWGCHIYSCVDCSKDNFPVFGYDPYLYEYDQLYPHFSSFSAWMEALIDGGDLWSGMKILSNK